MYLCNFETSSAQSIGWTRASLLFGVSAWGLPVPFSFSSPGLTGLTYVNANRALWSNHANKKAQAHNVMQDATALVKDAHQRQRQRYKYRS
jgi:hypothetical protein